MSYSRAAYSLLLRLGAPAYFARLWWRGASEPAYRMHPWERFGRCAGGGAGGRLWLHAVSLGETRAAAALVAALRQRVPHLRLLLTHGTATGREAGRDLLRSGDVQAWAPFDTPGATRRFIAHFRPSAGVLMETEVWPNLLAAAQDAGVPMLLANARLSERSLRKSLRLDALLRPAVASLAAVLAQSDDDAQRLRAAGAKQVEVTGNLKYDVDPDPTLIERGRSWRSGGARAVVLAASTREGEEGPLLDAWRQRGAPRPLLAIVPRHPQRFDEVSAAIAKAGFSVARRSAFGDMPPWDVDVWLGDSMGEMPLYYGAADVALLGGSFAPFGGQNLIEAAACGCPVVMGPHTFNFAEAADLAYEAGAALRVADLRGGVASAIALANAVPERDAASRAGLRFASRHRGAAARIADRVVEHMLK